MPAQQSMNSMWLWAASWEGVMEQVVEVSPSARGSFGALVRACRHQAFLSQEQLAARAELSERTVRNLEAGRVRSPRADTVRLLADALELGEPERAGWFAAAWGVDQRRAGPGVPGAGGPVRLPGGAVAGRPAEDCGWGFATQRWRRRWFAAGSGTGVAGAAAADSGPDQCELAELRQENRRLREDLEILKRAAAIFAAMTR
jgi:DNA-binding XRE family transcriptional regulator